MAEKRVSVRLGIVGGQEVEATFENLGTKGAAGLKKLGDAAERSGAQINRSSGAMRAQFQNVGYQVQDFAVQVAGGTSATRALAQQLPQLLSGFGLWGVLLGTATAILVPLIGYLWSTKEGAEGASIAVGNLARDVADLKRLNEVYSTKGIEQLIEKYGVLDAKILTLIEHQRQFAVDKAMNDARAATASLEGGLEGIRDIMTKIADIKAAAPLRGAALSALDLRDTAQELADKFGLTVDQADAMIAALDRAKGSNSLGDMADATADLTKYLELSKLKGTEFAGTVIAAEDALRQLNVQGAGVQGWLKLAIDWAKGLTDQLWSGAAAAAAIGGAKPGASTPITTSSGQRTTMETLMAGTGGRSVAPKYSIPWTPPALPAASRGGAGANSATNDLEKEAQRMFDATRSEAEKYAAELAKLDAVKKAGLVTDDTYDRQLKALQDTYHQNESAVSAMTSKLEDFVKTTQDLGGGIGDALVSAFEAGSDAVGEFVKTGKADIRGLVVDMIANFAKLSAQKYIFGPLAGVLSGALGGSGLIAAAIHHEGGMAGGGRGRAVPTALFHGARRMHGGGIAGLAPDEIPAILRRGERVLNQQETRGYGQSGPTVIFNVKDADSVRRSRSQLAADAARVLAMGRRGS
ncbi:MAG: phage tail tape measure C-terminal domain-containing protein [Cypionkella sp.]